MITVSCSNPLNYERKVRFSENDERNSKPDVLGKRLTASRPPIRLQ